MKNKKKTINKMSTYLHYFDSDAEYQYQRQNNYKEPWVSFTKNGNIKSLVGNIEDVTGITFFLGTMMIKPYIESTITSIIETDEITASGMTFISPYNHEDKYLWLCTEINSIDAITYSETPAVGDSIYIGNTWIGKTISSIGDSAITINDMTFNYDGNFEDVYYWNFNDDNNNYYCITYSETPSVGDTAYFFIEQFNCSTTPKVGDEIILDRLPFNMKATITGINYEGVVNRVNYNKAYIVKYHNSNSNLLSLELSRAEDLLTLDMRKLLPEMMIGGAAYEYTLGFIETATNTFYPVILEENEQQQEQQPHEQVDEITYDIISFQYNPFSSSSPSYQPIEENQPLVPVEVPGPLYLTDRLTSEQCNLVLDYFREHKTISIGISRVFNTETQEPVRYN